MDHDASVKAALDVMQAHIDALNARDEAALAATLHFPHFRMSGVALKTWHTPNTYFADFRARAGSDWSHSAFEDIRVLRASEAKVHLDAQINRYGSDRRLLTTFRSLWILTQEHGHWAAKFRSSFADR
ncbi:MAG: hypothetical protein AAGD04_01175 [Pseudomonadota bacterium]